MSKVDTKSAKQKAAALLQIHDVSMRLLAMKQKERAKADTRTVKSIAAKMGVMLKACETGLRQNMGKREYGPKDVGDEDLQ